MQLVDVSVLLDDEPCTPPAGFVDELKRSGLREPQILPALGVVRGQIEASRIGALAAVPGVRTVEQTRRVHVAARPT
jgi:hypothetical protein